ncbi:MAG: molybdenum cofactor cytidylyltransferase [Chloroflexi bacterium]|jgi:molybdenum cofactor cytidylyltransferase|nr:MAG: molybdenum cofactor cytidylyltransferase [Chloroflexota bacterium]
MPGMIAGLILAAGESQRMGRPKALLDWAAKPLLQHQIDELLAAGCDPIVVVLGHDAAPIETAITCAAPCRLVRNDDYRSGRASSIRAGAGALPDDATAIIVASVDTPLRAATVRALVEHWQTAQPRSAIVVPRLAGRNGHPALFDAALLPDLRAVQESSQGLRAVRRAHTARTAFLDLDDPLVALNLNTPQAYDAARAAHGSRSHD